MGIFVPFLGFEFASHHTLVLIVTGTLEDAEFHIHSTLYSFQLHYIELIESSLNFYIFVTYLLAIPTFLLLVVNIFDPLSRTYVQFTIVNMTWHDFTSYSILFT